MADEGDGQGKERSPSEPLRRALLRGNVVMAAAAYRALAREAGPEQAVDALAREVLGCCLAAGLSPSEETGRADQVIDRVVKSGWARQANQMRAAIEAAQVVGGPALERVSQLPKRILEDVEGVSRVGRALEVQERLMLVCSLTGFASACHAMRSKGVEVDFAGLAPLASEWLAVEGGSIAPSPWLGAQFKEWEGRNFADFWSHGASRGHQPRPEDAGPWDLAPMWVAALEARGIEAQCSPGAPAGKASSI